MTASQQLAKRVLSDTHSAFTLIELLAILVIVVVMAGIVLPGFARAKQRAGRIRCTGNLKQIGMAFKVWALDASNHFPTQVEGKAADPVGVSSAVEIFRYFQVMSNELATPRILVCPTDTRLAARDFGAGFSNANLSYFVALDASDTNPQMLLSGDRNLTNGTSPANRILVASSNTPAFWDHLLHRCQGNIALADGSVQQYSNARLREALMGTGETNRLALP